MAVYYNENNKFNAQWLRELIKRGAIAPGDVDEASIEDVVPADLAGYTQCHFFAGIGTWSYVLRRAGWPDDRRLWTGSCPCFPAGTLVLTSKGYMPIESVCIGDSVLTHKSRFRKVTHVGSETSHIVSVKGQGHWGLKCTPNHPFYLGNEEWEEAKNMHGKRWALVRRVPHVAIPPLSRGATGTTWDSRLGKYRVRGYKRGKQVYLGLAETREDAENIRTAAIRCGAIDVRGADRVDIESNAFARVRDMIVNATYIDKGC